MLYRLKIMTGGPLNNNELPRSRADEVSMRIFIIIRSKLQGI